MSPDYVYDATVVSVHDGDTVTLDVDLGFFIHVVEPFRLLGINAAELNTDAGKAARDYLMTLLPGGASVTVRSVKPDKFGGRFDGQIVTGDGKDVSGLMVSTGHAVPWNGQGPKPVPA